MLAAAAAWTELATELYSAALQYSSVTSGLAGRWQGPTSVAMAQAAEPYVAWLSATAGQAEQAAIHATAAAGAYEAAFAATVPPPVIAANRALLMSLIATNILGQNSPAIAATEAHYAEMWAQDATVMYAYAASSATASDMSPFASPPATTDPAGLAKQGAAVARAAGNTAGIRAQEVVSAGSQLMSTVPGMLQGLASSPASTSFESAYSSLSAAASTLDILDKPAKVAMYPLNFLNSGLSLSKAAGAPAAAAKAAETGLENGIGSTARGLQSVSTGLGGGAAVSGGMGRGLSIGALSVPPAWAATPAASPVVGDLSSSAWNAVPTSEPVGSVGLPVLPLAGTSGRGVGDSGASRFELRPTVVPRSPAGG